MLKQFGFATITISMFVACAQTDFSGSGRNMSRPNDNGNSSGKRAKNGDGIRNEQDTYQYTPISSGLEEGGWVNNDGMKELKELFKQAFADGTGPGTGTGGSDGKGNNAPGQNSDSSGPGSLGDTGGDSKSEVPSFSEEDVGVFWVPCEGNKESNSKRGSITGPLGAQVRMAGEFCPQRTQQTALTVLFVVDYSGSMTSPPEGPNDPGDATCGRLRAADALIKKFAAPEYKGYNVSFGLVGFSNEATVKQPLQDMAGIQRSLNAATWCGSDSAAALTNYRAAFETSSQFLSAVTGRVAIYFISDGSPTTGGVAGGSPDKSGLDAALALRSSRPDQIVLNAVFLGYNSTRATDPKGYLEQITGDPARVRLVDSADGLVEAVKSLDPGVPVIQKTDVAGSLVAAGTSQDVGIASLQPHATKPGAYVYLTQPLKLNGEVDKTTTNTLTVWATTSDGKKLTSEAIIDYKATP